MLGCVESQVQQLALQINESFEDENVLDKGGW